MKTKKLKKENKNEKKKQAEKIKSSKYLKNKKFFGKQNSLRPIYEKKDNEIIKLQKELENLIQIEPKKLKNLQDKITKKNFAENKLNELIHNTDEKQKIFIK